MTQRKYMAINGAITTGADFSDRLVTGDGTYAGGSP